MTIRIMTVSTTFSDAIRVRPITLADNNIIRVSNPPGIRPTTKFSLMANKGYTVSDPKLDYIYTLYSQQRTVYWVINLHGKLAGGGRRSTIERRKRGGLQTTKNVFPARNTRTRG